MSETKMVLISSLKKDNIVVYNKDRAAIYVFIKYRFPFNVTHIKENATVGTWDNKNIKFRIVRKYEILPSDNRMYLDKEQSIWVEDEIMYSKTLNGLARYLETHLKTS